MVQWCNDLKGGTRRGGAMIYKVAHVAVARTEKSFPPSSAPALHASSLVACPPLLHPFWHASSSSPSFQSCIPPTYKSSPTSTSSADLSILSFFITVLHHPVLHTHLFGWLRALHGSGSGCIKVAVRIFLSAIHRIVHCVLLLIQFFTYCMV